VFVVEELNSEELFALWSEFKDSHSKSAKDRLLIHYAPLVKFVAGRVAVGLPQSIDQADLVSYGMFGLIDAIDKFDLDRKIKFETYAISRIKGAIIDELRAIDWVPRSVRAKARVIEKAYQKLEAKLLRTPTDKEVAEELGISEKELQSIYSRISFIGVVAFDEVISGGDKGDGSVSIGDTIADKRASSTNSFEREETKQILAQAINKLGDREKVVLALYYFEGFTLAEIGDVLGVTESRVCQIHTKAVMQLKSKLAESERELI
jgi:RNA polymerase sigma factor for flagellar operon FliA